VTQQREYNELMERARTIRANGQAEELRGQAKIDELKREANHLEIQMTEEFDGSIAQAQKRIELEQKRVEIHREELAQSQRQVELARQLHDAESRRGIALRNRNEALMNPYTHTLEEIAGNSHWVQPNPYEGGYTGSAASGLARQILDAQGQVSNYVLNAARNGYSVDQGQVRNWATQIEQWQSQLATAGFISLQHTMETLNDAVNESNNRVNEIVQMARSLGISVRVHNSE
jgi:hypothetical protein